MIMKKRVKTGINKMMKWFRIRPVQSHKETTSNLPPAASVLDGQTSDIGHAQNMTDGVYLHQNMAKQFHPSTPKVSAVDDKPTFGQMLLSHLPGFVQRYLAKTDPEGPILFSVAMATLYIVILMAVL